MHKNRQLNKQEIAHNACENSMKMHNVKSKKMQSYSHGSRSVEMPEPNVNSDDYYKILGVEKGASEQEISKVLLWADAPCSGIHHRPPSRSPRNAQPSLPLTMK